MSSGAANIQDKTINKVALCSAVFAGFAYVGYSYARTAFCRKITIKDGDESNKGKVSQVVLRRLSQTTQTDALLGNLDFSNSGGRLIIRPKSVQERIRELNLRAQHFADAFIAIQSGNGPSNVALTRSHAMHGTTSMQCSPFHSPKLLSPVEVKHLIASRSTENLNFIAPDGSPVRPKWKRKSIRKKKQSPRNILDADEQRRLETEARDLYVTAGEELTNKVDILSKSGRLITPYEAKCLVAVLYSEDKKLIERALVTIANCAAFSVNLDFLRECGCIHRLSTLLLDEDLRLPAVQTLGNVILSEENITHAQECLPHLMDFVKSTKKEDEGLVLACLVVLTNLATTSTWHEEYLPILHRLYQLVDSDNMNVKLQSLRLLVNISCNKEMIPSLLAAEGPRTLSALISMSSSNDVLLRALILLSTLAGTVKDENLDHSDLPVEDKAASPDTINTSYVEHSNKLACIFGLSVRSQLLSEASKIAASHDDYEIRSHAKQLIKALKVENN